MEIDFLIKVVNAYQDNETLEYKQTVVKRNGDRDIETYEIDPEIVIQEIMAYAPQSRMSIIYNAGERVDVE